MILTRSYKNQDVIDFIRNDVVPENLACSIGFGLMRQAVRIHGDASNRPYDAKAAKRALEVKRSNPFTREVVTADPALVPDASLQKAVDLFRAKILGYTKVAAHLAETGGRLPNGDTLALAPGIEPRKVVVAQALRNALVKRMAARPILQPLITTPMPPPLPEHLQDDPLANAAYVMTRSVHTAERATAILPEAQSDALRGTWAALAAQGLADTVQGLRQPPTPERIAERVTRTPWQALIATFGASIAAVAYHITHGATEAGLFALARVAEARQVPLNDVLLFDQGQLLLGILEEHAYSTLLAVRPTLASGPRGRAGGVGIAQAIEGSSHLFIGQLEGGRPHGIGLAIHLFGDSYAAGHWQNGVQHGLGLGYLNDTAQQVQQTGRFAHGQFQEGVWANEIIQQRGRFDGPHLTGWGEITCQFTAHQTAVHVRGRWENRQRLQGELVSRTRAILFAASSDPGERLIGRIDYPDNTYYIGAIEDGYQHGYGILNNSSHTGFAGLWQSNDTLGPGAILSPQEVALGVWSETSGDFEVLQTLPISSPH